MKENLKCAGKYVTFKPTGKEYNLHFGDEGPNIGTSDEVFAEYDVEKKRDYYGKEYYEYTANNLSKLALFTNAYELRYEAIYQGERFGALVDPKNPIITLRSSNDPGIEGFKRMDKFYWDKDIDISEVELLTVKEPINLLDYLD